MENLPAKGYARVLVIAAYVLLGLGLGYVLLRYALEPLLPFLVAWGIAMAVRPAVRRICRRSRLPYKLVSFCAVLFVFLLILGLLAVLCGRILGEMRELSDDLMADAATAVGELFDWLQQLTEKLPFLDRVEDPQTAEQLRRTMVSFMENTVSRFSAGIPTAIMGFLSALPGILIFAVVMIVATFYLGNDVSAVNAFIARQLPEASRHYLFEAKTKLADAGIQYVKAYLLLLVITFLQLLIGFFFLKIPYALTLAALIALVDILPILGVGTVLLPWAAVLLLRGELHTGIGLLLLFAVTWIVRQVIEPKIVGDSIGLPPLVTLIVMYAGYRMMGFAGLFVFPLGAILLKNLNDIGVLKLWRK